MVSGLRQLGLAGFFATAVAFGPARNGYGLFLPDIREEFGLSTVILGLVASGLYAGYLAALFAVGLFAARAGPRLPVMIGLLSAGVGMALVALSSNAMMLAAGVILAGTSAGWSWAPYNDAVEQVVSPHSWNRALSIISTGTTFGIMVAGLTALAAAVWDTPWRAAWLVLALAALAAAAYNVWLLPSGPYGSGGRGAMRRLGWNWLVRAGSVPLFIVALSFGVVTLSTGRSWSTCSPALASSTGFPRWRGQSSTPCWVSSDSPASLPATRWPVSGYAGCSWQYRPLWVFRLGYWGWLLRRCWPWAFRRSSSG
jgi:predicted MFS family arabinose efflux permease